MSWDIFKKNVQNLADRPQSIDAIKTAAHKYAVEYDACMKRGFDTILKTKIEKGNVEGMENLFIAAFNLGLTNGTIYDIIGKMGAGVQAYWAGAQLAKTTITGTLPLPTVEQLTSQVLYNIKMESNTCTNPGTWPDFYALPPTPQTANMIDLFILSATTHLTTISGFAFYSQTYYNVGGIPQILPSLANWLGYTIAPTPPTIPNPNLSVEDDDVLYANPKVSGAVTVTTVGGNLPEESELDIDGYYIPKSTGVPNDNVYKATKGSYAFRVEKSSSGNIVSVDLGKIDLNAEWSKVAAQFIAKFEGFTKNATEDEGTPRLGFGSDKIYDGGNLRDVRYGDTTTVENALKVLQYEVQVSYKARLVGTGARQISETDFNNLNNKQRAACMSFVYNCGSLSKKIASLIRNGDYKEAAIGFLNGPVTGAKSKKVYPGLVTRRKSEAEFFSP